LIEKIKSGSLEVNNLSDINFIIDNAKKLGLNAINVPVKIDFVDQYDSTPTINEDSKISAVNLINALNQEGIKVILEPYPWVADGTISETQLDPTDKVAFFSNWKNDILTPLINEIGNPYGCYAIYTASNLVKLEGYSTEWIDIINHCKSIFNGFVTYRTNWWVTAVWDTGVGSTTEAYNNKLNNPLFGEVDFISIAAYYELNNDFAVPSVETLKADFRNVSKFDRGQDIYQEIKNFYDLWNKQIFFGELGIPSVEYAASEPWNPDVSTVQSQTAQANLYQAYKEIFENEVFFNGYSVFIVNVDTSNYYPIGKEAEPIITSFLTVETDEPLSVTKTNFQYPIVYDKFEINFNTFGEGILDNADNIKVRKKLNSEHTLEFTLPIDSDKSTYIREDNYIKFEGQLYKISFFEESRSTDGTLLVSVLSEHVYYELLDDYIESLELTNVTAHYALERVLFGTRFTADAVSVPNTSNLFIEKAKPTKGINQILENWNCEFKPDNFKISLYEQIGNDNGVQFRYKKNNKAIKRTTEPRGIITRLYVYGKDGLSIPAIDSVHINDYLRPKVNHITFSEVESTTELQTLGEEYLADHDTPVVSYEVDVIELKYLADYDETEAFDLGDTISIIDDELGINIKARIVDYEYYPLEPDKSKVVIANFIDNIADDLAKLKDSKRIIDQVTYKGQINTYWLNGIIDVLKNKFDSATSNWYTDDQGNIIFEAQDGTSAMKLAGNGFAIADAKVNGEWDWRTFGTGQGFTADFINAGILNAALVKVIADGATFIDGTGIHVVDPNNIERVRLGEYETGKYGLLLKNKAGDKTIIDEQGLLQTWQEGEEDNVDSTNPLVLDIYIPPESLSIYKSILRFRLKPFRAYSKGSASGGYWQDGTTSTLDETTLSTKPDASKWTFSSWILPDFMDLAGSHSHGGATGSAGGHNHGIAGGTSLATSDGGSVTWSVIGDHSHGISSDGSHAHGMYMGHDHQVTIPGHSHTFEVPNHAHDIVYGIYTSTSATNVTVKINGTDRTSDLGGGTGFTTDQDNLDVSPYLVSGWNTIEMSSSQIGRISSRIFLQCFLSA
jgi:phage minor structural protein